MTKRFNIKEAKDVKYHNETKSTVRPICPDCFKEQHWQRDTTEAYDCKNIFVDDNGDTVGQCCCYSYVHGYQE